MSWFGRAFGRGTRASSATVNLAPTRGFDQTVAGEANYQRALEKIVGGKTEFGVKHQCVAVLVCESDNNYDANAVAVFISGQRVGFLPKDQAHAYRISLARLAANLPNAKAKAKIVGGWESEEGEGHFGVKLNFKMPLAEKRDTGKKK